jgi:hypothetical protein
MPRPKADRAVVAPEIGYDLPSGVKVTFEPEDRDDQIPLVGFRETSS